MCGVGVCGVGVHKKALLVLTLNNVKYIFIIGCKWHSKLDLKGVLEQQQAHRIHLNVLSTANVV